MLTQFLLVLCFWGCVGISIAVSDIHLKSDEDINRQPNEWQITQHEPEHDNYRSQLIKKALDLLNEEKNKLKTKAINKCLYKNNGLRNRLKCVKELLSRTNFERDGYNYYDNTKYSNEYDYYEFQDLTKKDFGRTYKNQNNFSQDYLDVNDLLRTKNVNKKNAKKRYVLKVIQPNKYNRFDYDLTRFRKFNRNDKNILRTNSDLSDTSDSEENKLKTQNNVYGKTYIDNSDDLSSSDEDTEKQEPKLINPLVIYMQSPSRLYGASSRRRLPHFLPKRFHWDEDEMKDLTNYWFNGPQGKYWGLYKTPY